MYDLNSNCIIVQCLVNSRFHIYQDLYIISKANIQLSQVPRSAPLRYEYLINILPQIDHITNFKLEFTFPVLVTDLSHKIRILKLDFRFNLGIYNSIGNSQSNTTKYIYVLLSTIIFKVILAFISLFLHY